MVNKARYGVRDVRFAVLYREPSHRRRSDGNKGGLTYQKGRSSSDDESSSELDVQLSFLDDDVKDSQLVDDESRIFLLAGHKEIFLKSVQLSFLVVGDHVANLVEDEFQCPQTMACGTEQQCSPAMLVPRCSHRHLGVSTA
ncbi:hypothetical protein Sjap_015334 [Stephania japonica]|uniref:Uncharacterized protein n=1 Tax=Stephania japonica TaxID=461633 RepID=A0AAP0IKU2_9MAGN